MRMTSQLYLRMRIPTFDEHAHNMRGRVVGEELKYKRVLLLLCHVSNACYKNITSVKIVIHSPVSMVNLGFTGITRKGSQLTAISPSVLLANTDVP